MSSKAVHSGGGKGAVAPPEIFKAKFFIVQCISHSTSEVMQLFKLTNNLYTVCRIISLNQMNCINK